MSSRRLLAFVTCGWLCGCGSSDAVPDQPGEPDLCADGGCEVEYGVPEGACAEGFDSDGHGGCVAILPAGPCPDGQIAVPGDAQCRPIADCGAAPWGDIPDEPNRVHVDGSFSGAGDGSASAPFASIQQGIAAAEPGAIVAVAAGSYDETLSIANKPVRLWGRCPELVRLVATTAQPAAILVVQPGASGSVVRGLDVTGPGGGIGVSGPSDVVLEQLSLHDLGDAGILIAPDLGTGSVAIADTRIERASHIGIQVVGYEVSVVRTVVRETVPFATSATDGRGINVDDDVVAAQPSAVTISQSLIEDNTTLGVYFAGSTGRVEGTVIRNTSPQPSDMTAGRGLGVEDRLESGLSSSVEVVGAVIEGNHDVGLYVAGSDVVVAATTVRSTAPRASTGSFGAGVAIERASDTGVPATATVSQSSIADNHHVGVMVYAATASLSSVAVRATAPQLEGLYGDGLAVIGAVDGASLVLDGASVSDNQRAGVGAFGGSVSLKNAELRCNAFDLTGENEQLEYVFEDLGNNRCGCEEEQPCQVVGAALEAPTPVGE